MAIDIQRTLDFGNARKIINLPAGTAAGDAVNVSQLNSAIEGLAWKDSVRVATQANLTLSSPGATIDGITMASGDRVLVKAQTAGAENGIYIWNGAAVAMTRALDMDAAAEVEQAVVTVEEGTNANASYRQSAVNVTLGTTSLSWAAFGTGAGAATTTAAGVIEIATQAEVDAGTATNLAITPETLAASVFATKKFAANVGDGTATSYALTHNLGTRDVNVSVYRNSGNFDDVLVEIQRTSTTVVTLIFDSAPAANAYRAMIYT